MILLMSSYEIDYEQLKLNIRAVYLILSITENLYEADSVTHN